MADEIGRDLARDRWGVLILAAGFAAGAAIGIGLPALVAFQLRADPVEVPGEWLTTAPAAGDASSFDDGGPATHRTPGRPD